MMQTEKPKLIFFLYDIIYIWCENSLTLCDLLVIAMVPGPVHNEFGYNGHTATTQISLYQNHWQQCSYRSRNVLSLFVCPPRG